MCEIRTVMRQSRFPLGRTGDCYLSFPHPMTSEDYKVFCEWLEIQKGMISRTLLGDNPEQESKTDDQQA